MSTGTVDYFHETSGYGFIESAVTDEDIFFHMNEVGDEDPSEGQQVRFEYEHTNKGPRATTLSIIPKSEIDDPDNVETEIKRDGRSSPSQTDSLSLQVSSKENQQRSKELDSASVERELEVGDLVYLELNHGDNSLGGHNPLRDTYTLLLGDGVCPDLERNLLGSTVGKTGTFEVSPTDGSVRAPPRSVDHIDPSWVATLAEEADINTLQEFVDASGEKLADTELLDVATLQEIQSSFVPMVEDWELIEYRVVRAISWKEV